jgi:hopanoid biosynthesis associated protein HpnK
MGAALSRRLIVNADDFGRDPAANEGITEAHDRGILTCASLMVNEPSAAAAVELARRRPNLGVGLHLTLVCGHGALSPEQAPHLVDGRGRLSDNAPKAGMLYFFSRAARAEVEREVTAQVQKFKETGLPLDHVNGHLHLHLHPVVADILLDHAEVGDRRAALEPRPLLDELEAGLRASLLPCPARRYFQSPLPAGEKALPQNGHPPYASGLRPHADFSRG